MNPGDEPADGARVRLKGTRAKDESVPVRDKNAKPPVKPAEPTMPPVTKPATPANNTANEELPFDIGGDNKTKPAPTTPAPATTTAPTKPATTTQPAAKPSATPAATGDGFHEVVKGDTLFSLARRYNLTVARLKQLNGMTSDAIKIGQRLRVK
jgi:LysM repeat protein